jgi:hypothetical protein
VLGYHIDGPSSRPAPFYLRTAIEELGFLGVQTAWYWGHSFHGDEKFSFQNWSTPLTSYHDMVLDDDTFRTGAVGHPIAGTGYYLARSNGVGTLASFVITMMASTTWQYFREGMRSRRPTLCWSRRWRAGPLPRRATDSANIVATAARASSTASGQRSSLR